MKSIQATACTILVFSSLSAHAGTAIINLSVGGEISPGVYGLVQFGNAPPPPVFYAQPMIIVRQPGMMVVEPIYLHVPPGHAKNWARHCRAYNACNRPVYFVRSVEYEPGYYQRKNKGHGDEGRRGDRDRGEGRRDKGNRGRDHRD